MNNPKDFHEEQFFSKQINAFANPRVAYEEQCQCRSALKTEDLKREFEGKTYSFGRVKSAVFLLPTEPENPSDGSKVSCSGLVF
jgi:hypothetical protein